MAGIATDTNFAVSGTSRTRLSQDGIVGAISTQEVPRRTRSAVVRIVAGRTWSWTAFFTSQEGLIVHILT